jgi:F-type H+-transporting ATPase subunit b
MLIDWFTVAAQVVNFVVLVWLMKRFLYQPILQAIAAREQLIATQLATAAEQKSAAAAERADFAQKNKLFEEQCANLLEQATAEVESERQRLLVSARQAADALSNKRQTALHLAASNLNQAIAQQVQQEVFAIAAKTLADLTDSSLEERLVAVFITQLQQLETPARERLVAACTQSSEPALLRSARAMPAAQQAALQAALDACCGEPINLQFVTDATLIAGLQLSCAGQCFAWSIVDYLQALQQGVDALLQEQPSASTPAPTPAPTESASP